MMTFKDIINNAIDELERAYELLKDNEEAESSMLLYDIELSIERMREMYEVLS